MAIHTLATFCFIRLALVHSVHTIEALHAQALHASEASVATPALSHHFRSSRLPYRQVLANHGDLQYVGDITVGDQTLKGIFDTGSFELLVFSQKCKLCRSEGGNSVVQLYDDTRSRAAGRTNSSGAGESGPEKKVDSAFGSGSLGAIRSFESVRVGSLAAQQQLFWEVVSADMPMLETATFQAIVGVGPPIDKQTATNLRAMGELVPKNDAEGDAPGLMTGFGVRLFAFCVGRARGSPGYFVWNAEDPRHWPTVFTPLPVMGQIHWALTMHSARIADGNTSLDLGCAHGCGAVIDSGTSLIAAPSEVMMRLRKAIDAMGDNCSSNIDKLPDLHFQLGGVEFSLPPESYVGRIAAAVGPAGGIAAAATSALGGDRCEPLMMTVDKTTQFGPMWIIGLPFFRKYYATFDLGSKRGGKKIFAAEADKNCHPSKGSSLLSAQRRAEALLVDMSRARLPSWAVGPGDHVEL